MANPHFLVYRIYYRICPKKVAYFFEKCFELDMGCFALPLRIAVFATGWLAYWLEIAADWVTGVRRRTEYVREGKCKRCGRCCRCLALIVPEGISKRHRLVRVARIWHEIAMNFRFISEEESWLVYRCNYYRDGEEENPGHCSIYPFRHRLCRFFPRQGIFGRPALHPDCGFRFVKRDLLARRKEAIENGRPTFDDVLKNHQSAL